MRGLAVVPGWYLGRETPKSVERIRALMAGRTGLEPVLLGLSATINQALRSLSCRKNGENRTNIETHDRPTRTFASGFSSQRLSRRSWIEARAADGVGDDWGRRGGRAVVPGRYHAIQCRPLPSAPAAYTGHSRATGTESGRCRSRARASTSRSPRCRVTELFQAISNIYVLELLTSGRLIPQRRSRCVLAAN